MVFQYGDHPGKNNFNIIFRLVCGMHESIVGCNHGNLSFYSNWTFSDANPQFYKANELIIEILSQGLDTYSILANVLYYATKKSKKKHFIFCFHFSFTHHLKCLTSLVAVVYKVHMYYDSQTHMGRILAANSEGYLIVHSLQ